MVFLSKKERLKIVLDIVNKLKNFKLKNGNTINLYNEELCDFIKDFKIICNNYIKQEEDNVKEFKGILNFVEINKKIEYKLPNKNANDALFVIRIN